MSNGLHTNVSVASQNRPHFTKHQVHDVATSLTDSKRIAADAAEADRYTYRAKATVLGNAEILPYDAVYFDNLPGGMSGYWTVLSITHIFGGAAPYLMELEVGTDALGQTSVTPRNTSVRDVEAELNGLTYTEKTEYIDTASVIHLPPVNKALGVKKPTSNTTSVRSSTPDFSIIKKPNNWRAKKR